VETLTDPESYGKVVMQTFPLIGNYGVMRSDMESDRAWASAFIVRESCETPSNFRMEETLSDFLKEQGVVGVYGVDTRQLTKILREEGAMNVYISDKSLSDEEWGNLFEYSIQGGVQAVAPQSRVVYECDNACYTVALWNFGAKRSQIRALTEKGCKVISLPASVTAEEVLAEKPDGVILAGGAGEPLDCGE
jgi:carbamoyl-phosphate synthase small subunit